MKIGLCISIDSPTESLFTNGVRQNAIFCFETFRLFSSCYFINLGKQKDLSASPWNQYNKWIRSLDDLIDNLDICIISCAYPSEEQIVFHNMGPDYHIFAELSLYTNDRLTYFGNKRMYDQVWASPHIYPANQYYLETVFNCDCVEAPYIWSPMFLEPISKPVNLIQPNIGVFEANISVVKNCFEPLMIVDQLYKINPNGFQKAYFFCCQELRKKKVFVDFVLDLSSQKGKKLFFESRISINEALEKYTDVVLSHQRELGLNYLYLDVAWNGVPLIHNSKYIKDLGLYYSSSSEALNHLNNNLKSMDLDAYKVQSRKIISRYLYDAEPNVKGYQKLIENLQQRKE
jgi:hypothetical protein